MQAVGADEDQGAEAGDQRADRERAGVAEARGLLKARRVRIVRTDGSASLWVPGLYPFFLRWPGLRQAYTWLARHWPSLFARDFIAIGVKQ